MARTREDGNSGRALFHDSTCFKLLPGIKYCFALVADLLRFARSRLLPRKHFDFEMHAAGEVRVVRIGGLSISRDRMQMILV